MKNFCLLLALCFANLSCQSHQSKINFPDNLASRFCFSFAWRYSNDCYYNLENKLFTKSLTTSKSGNTKYDTKLTLSEENINYTFNLIKTLNLDEYDKDYNNCNTDEKDVTATNPRNTYVLSLKDNNYSKEIKLDKYCDDNNINEKNTRLYNTFVYLSIFLKAHHNGSHFLN